MIEHPLIANMREMAKSENEYSQFAALLFALQIPSICSRIELPKTTDNTGENSKDHKILYRENGKPWDKNLYRAWLWLHKTIFMPWYIQIMPFDTLCNAIYQLRNLVTHAGSLLELNSPIVLVRGDVSPMYSGNTLYVSVSGFCNKMFNAAWSTFWLTDVLDKKIHALPSQNYDKIRTKFEYDYQKFWDGRPDDLELYQCYSWYLQGKLSDIKTHLQADNTWSIGGLSRLESERLVEIVEECNTYGDKLDHEVLSEYFKKEGKSYDSD